MARQWRLTPGDLATVERTVSSTDAQLVPPVAGTDEPQTRWQVRQMGVRREAR
jgi:hypothetical protein